MNQKLTLLALLSCISLGANAAQEAFYTISEVQSASASNNGPWALGMAKDGAVVSLSSTNDAFSYFLMAPTGMDLAHRFRYEFPCDEQMSSTVCDTFWDGSASRALQWRNDTVSYLSQLFTTVSGTTRTEVDGVITKLGSDASNYVGYQVAQSPDSSGYYHQRNAMASVGGSLVALNSSANTDGHSFSSAYDMLSLGDSMLIAGTANTSNVAPDNAFGRCYNGNNYQEGEYRFCPGFNTQASVWLLTSGASAATAVQAPAYYNGDNGIVQTASVMGLADRGAGSVLAAGYSSTDKIDGDETSGRNVAVTWPVTVSGADVTIGNPSLIPLPKSAPGEGDKVLRHTWAVAVNSQGYVIGNQKYSGVKSRNTPVEMFIYNANSNSTSVPLEDSPSSGANSEAAGLNSHNQVVGWRDERSETQPVYQGSPRLQEAFLYNINSGSNWRLNDLICGKDGSTSQCQQNGYYYYIVNATAINDDGTIAATAYRYNSHDDWAKRTNPTVVSVKLSPNGSFDSNYDVPADRVVTNGLPTNDYGQSAGSGSLSWLTLCALLPLGWLRRRNGSM